jgi:uncharacterized membrane protein YheB (UPF0754 family)
MSRWLFLVPPASAYIRWLINSLLVNMRFHPWAPKKILELTFQGVIPKQQQPIAEKIGKLTGEDIFSSDSIG